MRKGTISQDLRERAVEAYKSGLTATYEATAKMFGIGKATVNRLLRRDRETGSVAVKPRGGNNPIAVDDAWLRSHAEAFPDARLTDRIAAWAAHSGREVCLGAMSNAMRRIGWIHKKRRPSPASATGPTSNRAAKNSSKPKRTSTSRA